MHNPEDLLKEISMLNAQIMELKARRAPLVEALCPMITGISIGDQVMNNLHIRGEVEGYVFISPTQIKLQVRAFKRGGAGKSQQVISNLNYDQWHMVQRAKTTTS